MIYLASRSPRRLELLKQIGITEVRLLLDEDEGRAEELEAIRPKESPTNYVERVARAKAEAAWQRLQELQRQDFLAEMAGSPVAEIAATTAPPRLRRRAPPRAAPPLRTVRLPLRPLGPPPPPDLPQAGCPRAQPRPAATGLPPHCWPPTPRSPWAAASWASPRMKKTPGAS